MKLQKFIPLNKLLLEDNEEVKKIKSLKNREEEYLQNGEFLKSISIIDKVVHGKMEQGIREVLISMKIEALICLKEYEQAEKTIQELIKLNKDYPMAYFPGQSYLSIKMSWTML